MGKRCLEKDPAQKGGDRADPETDRETDPETDQKRHPWTDLEMGLERVRGMDRRVLALVRMGQQDAALVPGRRTDLRAPAQETDLRVLVRKTDPRVRRHQPNLTCAHMDRITNQGVVCYDCYASRRIVHTYTAQPRKT